MSKRIHRYYVSPNTTDVTSVPNIISNPDFSNAATGWTTIPILAIGGTVVSGRMYVNGTSSGGVRQVISILSGDSIFIKSNIEITRYVAGNIGMYLANSANSIKNTVKTITNTLQEYIVSNIVIAADTITQLWIGNTASGNASSYFDNILVINLTTIFGSGDVTNNEKMLKALKLYDSSGWFSGTVNIPTEWMIKNAISKIGTKRIRLITH
jgi:hypothetical protein